MKRRRKKVSSQKKTFIWILAAILFIEILFVVDYSFTGRILFLKLWIKLLA